MKKLIPLLLALLALLGACGKSAVSGPTVNAVITVRCDTVAGRADYIPADGVILPETELAVPEGASAYDLFMQAAKDARLAVVNGGSEQAPYITGIAGLSAGDFGDLSGWLLYINGEMAVANCKAIVLGEGDRIEFLYSCDFGADIEALQ